MTSLRDRILKALRRGPLYDGILPYIVDASASATRQALYALQDAGLVTRRGDTWHATGTAE